MNPSPTHSAKTNGFIDPYESIPDENKKKVSGLVSPDDYMFLQNLRTIKGTNQNTVNILLHKLIHELKLRGITTYSQQSDFEQYVSSVRLVDGRPPESGIPTTFPCGETVNGDDGRRTPSISAKVENAPHVQPGTQSGVGTGGTHTGKKRPASGNKGGPK